jgi:hypothetical protein
MRVLVLLFCVMTASTRLGESHAQVVANATPLLELDGTLRAKSKAQADMLNVSDRR